MVSTEIAYDSTDHFNIMCANCEKVMLVKKVKTFKANIDFEGNKDKCTYIYVVCKPCNYEYHRKIYWNSEKHKGRDKRGRVNWKRQFYNFYTKNKERSVHK